MRVKDDNWSKMASAIIDTGAPISVLPYDLWRRLKLEILATGYSMRGVVPREECKHPVDISKIYARSFNRNSKYYLSRERFCQ